MEALKRLILCTFMLARAEGAVADEARIHLVAGAATTVTMPEDATVNVSRRGVVDLHHLGAGSWQITALHAGIVLIEARATDAPPEKAVRFLIDVAPATDGRTQRGEWPGWLCAPAGIRCLRDAGLIAGVAPSWRWLLQAADACKAARTCLLEARLGEDGLAAWRGALAPFAAAERVEVSAEGFVTLAVDCGEEGDGALARARSPFPEGLAPKGRLAMRCIEAGADEGYELRARLFLVDEATARTLGFDASASAAVGGERASGGVHREATSLSLLSKLEALAQERRATVVGEPVLRLLPGREALLRAGGEFQVAEFRDERQGPFEGDAHERRMSAASWKQTGLEMTVVAAPLGGERARLVFDAALKLRSRTGAEPALTIGSVKSAVDLRFGEGVRVAMLDLTTRAEGSGETPGMSGIPIIGPLFRKEAAEKASARLIVWVTLFRQGAAAPSAAESQRHSRQQ